jgi:hypothetical protein
MGGTGGTYVDSDNWRPEVLIAVLVEIQLFGDVGSCALKKLSTFGRGVVSLKYQ